MKCDLRGLMGLPRTMWREQSGKNSASSKNNEDFEQASKFHNDKETKSLQQKKGNNGSNLSYASPKSVKNTLMQRDSGYKGKFNKSDVILEMP